MDEAGRRARVRFPARLILGSPLHQLAFGFGTGLMPVAPGTFGTLPGVLLFLALSWLHLPAYLVALAVLSVAGVVICGMSSRRLGVHDHPGIVFDEMVGFCVAALPLLPALDWGNAPSWAGLLVVFVAFRGFDALKPPPIGWLDARLEGGLGIMLDDLAAGVMAAAASGIVLFALDGFLW